MFPKTLANFPFDFSQCKVNDVVVMDFLSRKLFGKFQPDVMQQIDLFWR